MTDVVIFWNEGLVPIEAFTTFGVSAKPSTNNPIGFFGTGLKYAVAVVTRLGGRVTVWIGEKEYQFYPKRIDFRGTEFTQIAMRQRNSLIGRWTYKTLPFTTQLGKTWKAWQAVREFESNVRDENGQSRLIDADRAESYVSPTRTVICVECSEFVEAYRNLHEIFRPASVLLYEDEYMAVYEGENKYVFYRGLRVYEPRHPSMFTYDLKRIELTEDRTIKWWYYELSRIRDSLIATKNEHVITRLLNMGDDCFEATLDFDIEQPVAKAKPPLYYAAQAYVRENVPLPSRIQHWYTKQLPKKPSGDDVVTVTATATEWQALLTFMRAEGVEGYEGDLTVLTQIRKVMGLDEPTEEAQLPMALVQGEDIPF